MKRILLSLVVWAAVAGSIWADPFEYTTWTNKDGNSFEARLERVEGKEITLRAKKGGKRYTVKREVLSGESKRMLAGYVDEARGELLDIRGAQPGGRVPSELPFKAAVLGLSDKLLALQGMTVNFTIKDIRVVNRTVAILEFEGGCFHEIPAGPKNEFFIKNDTLFLRTSAKGRPDWPYRRPHIAVDEDARRKVRMGEKFALRIGPSTTLDWKRVGVTDGPVFR